MRQIIVFILSIGSISAFALPSNPSDLKAASEIHNHISDMNLQQDDVKALDDLNDALERLDRRLERRVKAIEAARAKREQELAMELDRIINYERYECDQEPYFLEFEETCFDDYTEELGECFDQMSVGLE